MKNLKKTERKLLDGMGQDNLTCCQMRFFPLVILFLILIHSSGATPSEIELDMKRFTSFGNRASGTEAEKKSLDYIAERLQKLDISFQYQPLNTGKRGHSFSHNIIAEIPGKSTGRFIIATPVDGGAYSATLLLELAERFRINPPENAVILAFLGAEQGVSEFHPYGSRMASEILYRPNNVFAIYLKSERPPKDWEIRIGGNGTVAPYWFTRTLSTVLSLEYIPFKLRGMDIYLARLGLQGDIGPLQTWMDSHIPTILLEGSGSSGDGESERQTKHFLNAVINLDRELEKSPKNRGSVYIFLRLFSGSLPRTIPEIPYISAFLVISAFILSVILLRFRDVRVNMRRFTRYWWAGPILFVIAFLFFFLSTLIVEETILLADFPEIWKFASGTFVFFKISIAATLSLNFILITRGLPLPRNPHFYSYAAIITSGIASLVFTALDVTLTAYSLWTIINMLLFTAYRNIRLKSFFLLLSVIPSFMGLVVIIKEPYSMVIKALLLSRVSGSLVLTLLIFPIILAVTSLSYWRIHYDKVRYSALTPVATLTLSLSSIITLFWIAGLNPYSSENLQPLEIVDHINLVSGERKLEISSPRPIGDANLSLDGQIFPLENLDRTADVHISLDRTPLRVESNSRSFLGRRTITAIINGESRPNNLIVHLNSTDSFTLHVANLPFEMSPSGTSAEIFIGDNPPFPISLKFTVNDDALLTFSVIGNWETPENPPRILRSDISDHASRTAMLEVPM